MGWASGSSLASAIEGALQPLLEKLSPDEVMTAGEAIARVFQDHDCDNMDEADGFIGDAASRVELHEGCGAPLRPEAGATAVWYGSTWAFNGRRWDCTED